MDVLRYRGMSEEIGVYDSRYIYMTNRLFSNSASYVQKRLGQTNEWLASLAFRRQGQWVPIVYVVHSQPGRQLVTRISLRRGNPAIRSGIPASTPLVDVRTSVDENVSCCRGHTVLSLTGHDVPFCHYLEERGYNSDEIKDSESSTAMHLVLSVEKTTLLIRL